MSNIKKSYEIKADNAVNILSTGGETEMSGIFWAKNFMSESLFAAIAQPLFFAFGGITLAKMLIDSSKSYKKQYIETNQEGYSEKPTSDIKSLKYLLSQIESSQHLEPRTKKALKGVLHFFGFMAHLIMTQVADVLNPNSTLTLSQRAFKAANLAVLVVTFGAACTAIAKVAPYIFLGILTLSGAAAIYEAGVALKDAFKRNERVSSSKWNLGLTITSFASTIVGVIGAFLLPGLGLASTTASKAMSLAGAAVQPTGVALAFKNTRDKWSGEEHKYEQMAAAQ